MVDCVNSIIIYEILSRCKELVAVSLENCPMCDLSCKSLAKNTNLQILNLSAAHGLTAIGIQSILVSCRELTELNVAWTKLDRESVLAVCNIAPNSLLRLNLSGCRNDHLLDADIAALCFTCPNLIELDISDASELTKATIDIIANCLPKLEILSCSRCYKIDPLSYANLPPLLKELNLFNSIHEASWPAFETILPQPVVLNASPYSIIARPTVGIRRTSIWEHRVRDE